MGMLKVKAAATENKEHEVYEIFFGACVPNI